MKTAGFAVIEHKGSYLLVLEKIPTEYGLWGLPGGKTDPGETVEQAAVREVFEEVALSVSLERELFAAINHDIQKHLFLARGKYSQAQATDDVLCLHWFSFDQIKKLHVAGRLRGDWVMAAIATAERARTRLPA